MLKENYLQPATQKKGKPISGWLWLVGISLIASLLSTCIALTTTIKEFLQDDWQQYLQTSDRLLNVRISIYIYMVVSMLLGVGILLWALKNFFQRKKAFINIFLGLIGYSVLTEVIRILLLDHYARLTDQHTSFLESNFTKLVIVGAIAGIYLNKANKPQQTFVN